MGNTGDERGKTVGLPYRKTAKYNSKTCKKTASEISKCARVSDRPNPSSETWEENEADR